MSVSPAERVALITGASGGLGDALVRQFMAADWQVVAGRRALPAAPRTGNPLEIQLDVTRRDQVEDGMGEILAQFGRVDALINNAGLTADDSCGRMSDEDWQRVLDVNLRGAFLCSQMASRQMIRQRSGHIINISSLGARRGPRGQSNYAAAKAGLVGLTQSLAKELGSRNVRVNGIFPGVMPTKMTAGLSHEKRRAFAEANALGRLNSTEEVARFIVFLADTENISGQVFQLDSRIAPWT